MYFFLVSTSAIEGWFDIRFSIRQKSSRVCDYLVELYPQNADLIYVIGVYQRSSSLSTFHRFSFQFTDLGN